MGHISKNDARKYFLREKDYYIGRYDEIEDVEKIRKIAEEKCLEIFWSGLQKNFQEDGKR